MTFILNLIHLCCEFLLCLRNEKGKKPGKFKISQKCNVKFCSLNDYILAIAHNFLSVYAIYKLNIFKYY